MTDKEYAQFFDLLEKIINEEAPADEKAEKLKAAAGSESDVTNIFEFAAWWDVDNEEEEDEEDEDDC